MSDPRSSHISKRVKVGVVGLGFMGVTHLRAYLENPRAEVVAVCGVNRVPVNGVLRGVAGNIKATEDIALGPHVKVYRTLEALLKDPEIQLVDICTPTHLHVEHAIAALDAGKSVLCEKPIARTSAGASKILKAIESAPGFFMPAMCMRFWPGWDLLKQVVAEKTYGKVLAAHFFRFSEMPAWGQKDTCAGAEDSGGALFDLHIHDTDFVNHLFGRPAGVFSSGVVGKLRMIDHVTTQYYYPDGPAVHAEGSWLLKKGFKMGYMVHCERATLDFDLARSAEALMLTGEGQSPRVIKLQKTDGYTGEIDYFVDCIGNQSAPKIVTALDGVAALEICEAEEKSVRSGQFTEV